MARPKAKRKRYPSDDPKVRKERGYWSAKKKADAPSSAPAPRARARASATRAESPQTSTRRESRKHEPDLSAFKRARGPAPKLKALPSLEELAGEKADHLERVTGGVCPGCGGDQADADRYCATCGHAARNECASCHAPMAEGQAHCRDCGDAAPAPAARGASSSSSSAEPLEAAPAQKWEADDCFMVGAAVDMLVMKLNPDDELSKDQTRRINERAAAVANKHFRGGGRWKEELALGMAIAGAVFPAAYVAIVIAPREKKRTAQKRLELLEQQLAAQQAGGLRVVSSPPATGAP